MITLRTFIYGWLYIPVWNPINPIMGGLWHCSTNVWGFYTEEVKDPEQPGGVNETYTAQLKNIWGW